MYQCLLFVVLFLSKPFQYKCEIKDTKSKIQAIIMPFDKSDHNELNNFNKLTNRTQGQINIKAKKIYITVWLKRNTQEYFTNDEVIIIDQAYDVVTSKMSKLIDPYIIVIRQDEVLESYKLKHLKMVNAEVKEKVYNKELNPHYLGCYADLQKSSCTSSMMTNNIPMKYSEGFCCSCKMAINIKRQLNDCQGRSRFKHVIHTTKGYGDKFDIVINQVIDNITSNDEMSKTTYYTKQIRGGQDCDNTKTPGYVDEPYRYHESSHCLQFSDLWYNVNKLESSSYYHSVTMSIYKKYIWDDKPAYKKIFSKVKLSTNNKNYKNSESTVKANYMSLTFGEDQYYSLDIDRDRLLVPGKISSLVEYPQEIDNPNKYLIVNANNISMNGDECNKIGVSYEAFYKQSNRCGEQKSSCLKNQPSHLWKHDTDAMNSGKPGSYFLGNFVKFPQNKDVIQENNGIETLNLLYEMDYTSELFINAETNYNNVFSTRSLLEIVEIYSDATKRDQTIIVAAIYNVGMVANSFQVQLINFPLNAEQNCTKIQSCEIQIFPYHRHNYILNIPGSLVKSITNCTLQVLDKWKNVIAWRHILISEANRCFCVWQCECSCTTIEYQSFISNCKTMSKNCYMGAGFRGDLPPILNHNSKMNIIHFIYIFILLYWIIVLLIGIMKAMIGLCFKPISSFGHHLIFHEKSKNLKCYLEPEICLAFVIYDKNGYAVHPYTKKRTIQLVSKKKEFFTNIFFLVLILTYFMKEWCFIRIFNDTMNITLNEACAILKKEMETEDNGISDYEYDVCNYDSKYCGIMEPNVDFSDIKSDNSSMSSLESTKGESQHKCYRCIHYMTFD